MHTLFQVVQIIVCVFKKNDWTFQRLEEFFSEGGKVFCVDFLLTELYNEFFCQTAYHTALYRGGEKWLQSWKYQPFCL